MDRDEDPYALYRWVLELTSFAEDRKTGNKKRFRILNVITISVFLIDIPSLVLYPLQNEDFKDNLESLQYFVSMFHLYTKFLNLRIRQSEYNTLMDESTELWLEMNKDVENREIMIRTRKIVNRTIKIFMVSCILTSPISALMVLMKNLNLEPEKRQMPLKVWDPIVNTLGEDYFYSRVSYVCFLFGYSFWIFSGAFSSSMIPCIMASGHLKVLIRMLKSEKVNVSTCANIHQRILRMVKNTNNLFSEQLFLEVVLSAIQTSFRCYLMILSFKNYDANFIRDVVVLSMCLLSTYCICLSGQIITDASEELFRAMYQTKWHEMSLKDRRSLSIMLTQASKPLSLRYRTLVTFNMERCSMVMQATFSYITILMNQT